MTQRSPLKIGINGFGRIGRCVARILLERKDCEIVHINDLNHDLSNMAYLLKYDTTYGRLPNDFRAGEGTLHLGGAAPALVTHRTNIAEVDWAANGVDVVIEATGVGQNEKDAHRVASDRIHVLVTHASPSADFTLMFGVTDPDFDPRKHRVISTSICDANACAPVLKAVNERFGISSGFITTLHPWLSYQSLTDGPSRSQAFPGDTYNHYPLGRSSVGSLIPKPTTVVSACERVLPQLKGKLQCFSYRVPTPVVSSADMTLILDKTVSKAEVIRAFEETQAKIDGAAVFRVTDEPLVSVDYEKDPHSAIVDTRWIMPNHGNQLKIVLWYDNEWGYSSRVADSIRLIARRTERG
jgi:glyceraldehyde 3-phosphate dehydrogenase